jgi:hypothetical protein
VYVEATDEHRCQQQSFGGCFAHCANLCESLGWEVAPSSSNVLRSIKSRVGITGEAALRLNIKQVSVSVYIYYVLIMHTAGFPESRA